MGMKNVLLFTGKFPEFGEDLDGGSITVNSIIQALGGLCRLDVTFTRTLVDRFTAIDGVNHVEFETYNFHSPDKFERRLKNKKQLSEYLLRAVPRYDRVVITHCSKAFGADMLSDADRRKVVLFPMFLSPSYKRSGENPPEEYMREEELALSAVGKIITPSFSEKQDMVDIYKIPESKITVIPRGYSDLIKPNIKPLNDPIKLLYIASVKEQKNNLEAIVLLKELKDRNIKAELHFVGGIQNGEIFDRCRRYIEDNELDGKVIFYGVISQKQLAQLISTMDINISVSNWETYGRGIFEGMAGGLPTVVYNRLECVARYLKNGHGIIFVDTHDEFFSAIISLVTDSGYYSRQAKFAAAAVENFSESRERMRLIKELI